LFGVHVVPDAFSSKNLGACSTESVGHAAVASIPLFGRAFEITGVVEALEPPEEPLIGAGNERQDLRGCDEAEFGDEPNDVAIAILKNEWWPPISVAPISRPAYVR
jgi:hypothetical protein